MVEDLEPIIKAQLSTLRAQIDILRDQMESSEESAAKLKYIIANDLVESMIKRFERNEKKLEELTDKINSFHLNLQEQMVEFKRMRERQLSDIALAEAISKIFEEKEVKVSPKPLYELKK